MTAVPAGPARRWRRLWLGLLAAAALLGLLFSAGEWSGWRLLAGPAERWLSQRLGRTVLISHAEPQSFRLSLWRGIHLSASQLRIDGAAWSGNQPLLEAETVAVQMRWRDLIGWRQGEPMPVQQLGAERLVARLVRRADGLTNWQRADEPPDAAPTDLPARLPVAVNLLWARDGRVAWVDAITQTDVTLRFALHEADTTSRLTTAAPVQGLQATATGSFRGLPVHGSLATGSLRPWLTDAGTTLDLAVTLALTVGRARMSFDGTVQDPLRQRDLRGRFTLAGPSLAAVGQPLGVTLPTTAAFQMNGQLARQGPLWSAVVARASIGRSLLDGALQFDSRHAPRPQLAGRLHAQALWLADLGPTIGTRTPEQPATTRAPGRVLPDRRFDLPSLRAMDANVLLRMDRLEFGTAELQSAAPLGGHLLLRDGVLRLDDLDVHLAQGRIRGHIELDGRGERALWQAALQGRDLRLEQWVRAVQRSGQPPYASGRLGANLRIAGAGRSTAELLASADGRMGLHWSQGRISHLLVEAAGLDIAQGLGMLLKGDDALAVSCGMADLEIRQGRVTPRAFVIDTTDSRLWLTGSLSLADERLALLAQVQPKDWSPLSLRAPLHIDGSLAAPRLALDKRALAGRVVPAALLAMLNPLAALIPLLDFGEPGPTQDCRGLLDAMRRSASPRPPPRPL